MKRPTLLCVAGEASGDRLLAPVVARVVAAGARAVGVGGDASALAGLELCGSARELAAHGLGEALGTAPAWLRTWGRLGRLLSEADALLLVDFPEMNTRLLRRAEAPAYYLAPPQAWAWRPWRARHLRGAAAVGCLLPFAAEWYRARGVAAEWVGHPLAETRPPPPAGAPALALLPGSRDPAVRRLLPVMLAAAARLGCPVHVAVAPTVDRAFVQRAVTAADLPCAIHETAGEALAAATVALAGAGTATLEAALAGRPVVVLGGASPLTGAVLGRALTVEHVALPNLLLGRRAFPERVLDECRAELVARDADAMLSAPERWAGALADVRGRLEGEGFAERVGRAVLGLLGCAC